MHQARSRHTYERHITFLHFSLWVSSNSCLFTATMGHGGVLFWPLCITWPAIPRVHTALKSPHSLMLFLYSASRGLSARVCPQNSPVFTLFFNCTFIQTVTLLQQRVSFSRESWCYMLIYMYQRFCHCNYVCMLCTYLLHVCPLNRQRDRRCCTLNFLVKYIFKNDLLMLCWQQRAVLGKSETEKNNPGSPVLKQLNAWKDLIDAKNTPLHMLRKWHSHVPGFIIDLF